MKRSNFIGCQSGEQFIVHGLDCLESSPVRSQSLRGNFQKMFASVIRVTGSLKTAFLLKAVSKVHHLSSINAHRICYCLLALWLIVNQMQSAPFAGTEAACGFHVLAANFRSFIAGAAQQVGNELAELWRDTALVFHRSTICQGTVRLAPKVMLVPFL